MKREKDKNKNLVEQEQNEIAKESKDVDLLIDETDFSQNEGDKPDDQKADANKDKKEKNKNKKTDESVDDQPFSKRASGCCGCFTGIAVTFSFLFVAVFFCGYIFANSFLKNSFGVTLGDCFSMIGGVYTVNEDKVITEKATAQDKDDFYAEISDGIFIKSTAVDKVVDTALEQFLVPTLNKTLNNGAQENPPTLSNGQTTTSFAWETFLQELCEDGLVDTDKVKDFMESELEIEQIYDEQFVLSVKGKGIVALVESLLNNTLDGIGYEDFKGLFGVKQVRFGGGETKSIDLTLQVKARELFEKFIYGELSDKLLGSSLPVSKRLLGSFSFAFPKNLIAGVKLVIEQNASAEIYINNMDWQFIRKWLGIVSKASGKDLESTLNTEVDKLYSSLNSAVSEYFDLTSSISDGALKLDLYEVVSKVLNKSMKLEGDKALDKYETASAVSSVMYANTSVNGNGRNEILQQAKATETDFLNANWESVAEQKLLDWLYTNVAFAQNKDLDDVLEVFTSQNGGNTIATFLEFLDVNYLKQGLAFMKEDLRIDETLVAYLFEGSKEDLISSLINKGEQNGETVVEKIVKTVSLEYVKLQQQDKNGIKHTYLTLGISAPVDALLSAVGQEKLAFIKTIIGDELFICASADITSPTPSLVRDTTTFRLNGLSQAQTMQIVQTLTKIIKQDIVAQFVDKYVNEFADKINSYGFSINFVVNETADGKGSSGTIVLPSTASLLQALVKETSGKEIDANAFIGAVDAIIRSDYIPTPYTAYLSQTCKELYGDENKYSNLSAVDGYGKIIINQIYSNYFLKTDENASGYLAPDELVDKVIEILDNPDGALGAITGDEDGSFVEITRAYFESRSTLESTKPIVDGHTLAHLISATQSVMVELFGADDNAILDIVTIEDIEFVGSSGQNKGKMKLIVSVNTDELIEQFATTLGDYKNFVKQLLGGAGKKLSLTLSINLDDGANAVAVAINDLTDAQMEALLDTFVTFGFTMFDFDNPDSELVKLSNNLKDFLNSHMDISDGKVKLPSLFTLASENLVEDGAISDENLFFALHDYVLSNASTQSYNDEGKLAETNQALAVANRENAGIDVAEQTSYASVVRVQVEEKYMLKDGKTVGDVIDVLSAPKNQRADRLIGEYGIVKISRAETKNYFSGVSPNGITYDKYEKTTPIIDGHTLAYILDTYKEQIKKVVEFEDEGVNELFNEIEIGDVFVDANNNLTLVVRFKPKTLLDAIGGEEVEDGKKIFELFSDNSNAIMSVKLTKSLIEDNSEMAKVEINDLTKSQLANLSSVMKEFGIDYFDVEKEGNLFDQMAVELKKMINDFMPYDTESGCFTLSSLFVYAGENIEVSGSGGVQTFSGEETYNLIKTLTLHQANPVLDKQSAKTAFDEQTATYYYLKDGTDTMAGVVSGNSTENSLAFVEEVDGSGSVIKTSREIIVEQNTEEIVGGVDMHGNPTLKRKTKQDRVYINGFTVNEQHLAGLISNLGLISQDADYTVDSIRVMANGQIRVYVILESAKFVDEEKMGVLKKFEVLPEYFHVWIPLNFTNDADFDSQSWGLNNDDTDDGLTYKLRHSLAKLGINLDTTVNEYKAEISEDMKGKLEKYDMAFVPDEPSTIENNEAGLSMPSMAKILSITRNDTLKNEGKDESEFVSEEDTIFMLDNFVCYTTDDYDFNEQEQNEARAEFMRIMSEYYMVSTTKANSYNNPNKENNAYWNTLYALNLKDYDVENGETDVEFASIIDWSQIGNLSQIVSGNFANNKVNTSKVFAVAISTVLFKDVANFGDFVLEQVFVEKDGWITVEGEIYLYHAEEVSGGGLGELSGNICPNMKMLMPEVVTVQISLNLYSEEFNYEIVDMPNPDNDLTVGVGETIEQVNSDKLMDVFDKFGASMDRSDFNEYANTIRNSILNIFDKLEGSSVICSSPEIINGLAPEQIIKATTDHDHDHEGCDFEGVSGIYVPSLKSYLFRNWGIVVQAQYNGDIS